MPPARPLRRAVTNENDENANSTRLTRAKAAALDVNIADPPKKTMAPKRSNSTATLNGPVQGRKRAALGDVSNVNKLDHTDSKATVLGKGGLAKTAKPTGITKTAKPSTARPALGVKSTTTTSSETKRAVRRSVSSSTTTTTSTTVKKIKTDLDDSQDNSTENVHPNIATVKQEDVRSVRSTLTPPAATVALTHKTLEQLSREAKDLDSEDIDDPLMVAEYVHEIFDYMRELEITTLPNPDYMENQSELEWKMRGILMDWLLEVHSRFRLLPETLFLTVNIIDRFLSRKVVQLERLQLVGVTAMFIASKYEEVLSPHVQNFKHVADDGFTEQEILSAERFILAALDYDLSYPNPMNFLRRISKADNYDIQTRTLGKYLLEIGFMDHRFMPYPPSHVAAASMYLARLVLDRGEWDATLAHYAGYTEQDIEPVFKLMVDYLQAPIVHDAFFRKYASKKFLKASIVLRQWAKKWAPTFLDSAELTSSDTVAGTPVV